MTERTFFGYSPDKREVLFEGAIVLQDALTAAFADAPQQLGPLDTLFRAFRSVAPLLENNRPYSKPRLDVISSTPALPEQELAKLASLTEALARALRARGVTDFSRLAARTGMAAFAHSTSSSLEKPEPGLRARLPSIGIKVTDPDLMPLRFQLGYDDIAQRAVQGVAFWMRKNEKNLHDALLLLIGACQNSRTTLPKWPPAS